MPRIKTDIHLVAPDRKGVYLQAGDEIPDWAEIPDALILGPDDPEPEPSARSYQQRRKSW